MEKTNLAKENLGNPAQKPKRMTYRNRKAVFFLKLPAVVFLLLFGWTMSSLSLKQKPAKEFGLKRQTPFIFVAAGAKCVLTSDYYRINRQKLGPTAQKQNRIGAKQL